MAATLLSAATWYAWAGLGVAAVFLLWGAARCEPNARGAWAFRPLLVPACVLIWPLVLARWAVLESGWDEARRHRPPRRAQDLAALALALAIPAIIATALVVRQDGPREAPPVLLEAPEPA
ncbi:MAG: hypothetical protein AAGC57_14615 [Pseudomonadota bacterium]